MEDLNDYRGYMLSGFRYELTDSDMNLLDTCIWIVDNNESIRSGAENWGYSKTTLHRYIHRRLKRLSWELYRCVMHTLNTHVGGRRQGGRVHKRK